MATIGAAPVHRLSVEDVIAMAEANIFEENARVELVDGVLVEMNPIGAPHESIAAKLCRHFVLAVEPPREVRMSAMFLTGPNGYVLPDLEVVDLGGRVELPTTALIAIEIAQSSHARDAEKAADYAASGVPEYWIVDLVAELVRVHTEPSGRSYGSVVDHQSGVVTPLLDGVPPVALDWLFGRA